MAGALVEHKGLLGICMSTGKDIKPFEWEDL